ncbi:MAG TPA: VIT domain-containing protein [Tepidisphaeraceae bacterium]|nr:VIT domain-containing protein [Tepidisphaeraceae bacterium]
MIGTINRRAVWLILPMIICWITGCATSRPEARPTPAHANRIESNLIPPSVPSMAGVAYDELWVVESPSSRPSVDLEGQAGSGTLLTQRGPNFVFCPLVKTNIKANVVGCIASVDVSQRFQNPNREPTEATYTFPLPANAAVCDFVMSIGPRHIRGVIRPRREAEQIYREARQQGYRASLLVEHAPHLFTQSIGAIEPQKSIDIEMRYVEPLAMEDGSFSLRIPLSLRSRAGEVAPTERDGRNISVSVSLDPGAPLTHIECTTHPIEVEYADKKHVHVLLQPSDQIPNRQMVLGYQLAGGPVLPGLFTHVKGNGGFAALMLAAPLNAAKGLAVRDLKITWTGTQVQTLAPGAPADLPAGRSEVFIGRFTGPAPTSANLSGHTANGGEFLIEVPAQADPGDGVALENVWARMSVAALLLEQPQKDPGSLESQITRIAMESGLVSPFTAYVCVDATAPTPH